MARLSRLATILRVAARYRLDTFLRDGVELGGPRLPMGARLLARATALLPAPKAPRGERLRRALEDLGPIFIKFGQLLSTRPDLIPADICRELDRLQDRVPPFPSDQFIAIVEGALKGKVADLFQRFDETPLASASVAQVHGAQLMDGREVVVKAIRPGIEQIIGEDIDLLFSLARWVERNSLQGRRLHPVEIVADYRHTIFDELNLQREAANASLLRRNFLNSPLLYVPEVHWPLTNEKVMVSERIHAAPVTDLPYLQSRNTDMKVLAERGVEIFFTQVFEHNFFHADMHPGNIFVDASDPARPRYLAVDCAIVGSLTDEDRYYLARNLVAIFRRDYRQVAELHVLSGWVPEKTPINAFESAIRTVCEPIFERPLKDISFGQVLVSLFRTAQRFDMEVQPALVLLQKTLLNIEGLGRQLYPDLDLWTTAHPFLEKWLKRRFRPEALLARLKRHGPEWLEQFPEIPQLVYQTLELSRHRDRAAPAPVPTASSRPRGRARLVVASALMGIGAGSAFPQWSEAVAGLPTASLALFAAGALLLLLR
ncbi:MAG: ubiquinone biosynthesis regulatory protein kinase UbiB [Pseudomonadota bacterium]|nr:ubiquinone biosynthesis regulatory protein kinase UbiB [Pseudomonadota bacterium]